MTPETAATRVLTDRDSSDEARFCAIEVMRLMGVLRELRVIVNDATMITQIARDQMEAVRL